MDQLFNREPHLDPRFLAQLGGEVEVWRQDGVITGEQAQTILSRYPDASSLRAVRTRHSLVMGLSILGAVLLGLGVIAFVAANWDSIPRGIKLGLLVAGVGVFYGSGYFLWQRQGYAAIGVALTLLGCITYGAGVHLIGQIYHIPVDHPNLTAFWFLGVVPIAYTLRSRPITTLAIVLFLTAVWFRLDYWNEFSGKIETGSYFPVYVALGLALYAIGQVKDQFQELRQMGNVFRAAGLVVAFGGLYFLTFEGLHDEGNRVELSLYRYWILAFLSAAGAVAPLIWLAWGRSGRLVASPAQIIEVIAVVILLIAALLMAGISGYNDIAFAILFNVLFSLAALGLMISGYLQESEGKVNLSLFLIAVYLISRYFEYAIEYLESSLVFVGAGLVLLLLGFILELGRRKMLSTMRSVRDEG